jgi:hypothetical protein
LEEMVSLGSGGGTVERGGRKERGLKGGGGENKGGRKEGTGRSLFSCYASIDYPIFEHSTKALHLSYSCPVTDFHGACASDGYFSTTFGAAISPLSHDCACPMSFDDYPPRSVCSVLPGYDLLYNAVRSAMPDKETVCTVVHFYRSAATHERFFGGRFGACGRAGMGRIRRSVNEVQAILGAE